MIITYFRSSSYNSYSYCEQQYFINYVLGWQGDSNLKADMGTICHKALECLAALKKYQQNNPRAKKLRITDDAIGDFECLKSKFLEPDYLTDAMVDQINASRMDKSVYKVPNFLSYGHVSYGPEVVKELYRRSYEYYSTKYSHHKWTAKTARDVENFIWMALDYKGGICDPRKRTIVEPERRFDFTINEPWAKYNYDGMEGQLALKGTIDLITQVDDHTYEIIDWKTGQRLDWATGEVKDYKKLSADPQLMLYYYAAKTLYPDKEILLTIFFIRDGGPFSVCFDDDTIVDIKDRIRERFNKIRSCRLPKQLDPNQKDFRCNRLCHYYKNKWPGTNKNMCQHIRNETITKGIDYVTLNMKAPGHSVGNYNAPGE